MFDFLRKLGQSAAEKRQERLNAYLDGELSPREALRFEAELEADATLRSELAQLRQIKASVQALPKVRAPRNYTLDPAVYGVPAAQPATNWLPALRVATALAAFFFVLTVALDLFILSDGRRMLFTGAQEAEVADIAVEEVQVEGEGVAVTRVVTEMAEEPVTEEVETADEAPALAPPPPTDSAEEEAMAAEAVEEETAEEREEAVEEAEAEDAGEPAAETGLAQGAETEPMPEEPAGGGGRRTPTPMATAGDADERALAAEAPEASATETAALELTRQTETEAETATTEPVDEERFPSLSVVRIAQIVLGLLLAGLLVTWALIRRY